MCVCVCVLPQGLSCENRGPLAVVFRSNCGAPRLGSKVNLTVSLGSAREAWPKGSRRCAMERARHDTRRQP